MFFHSGRSAFFCLREVNPSGTDPFQARISHAQSVQLRFSSVPMSMCQEEHENLKSSKKLGVKFQVSQGQSCLCLLSLKNGLSRLNEPQGPRNSVSDRGDAGWMLRTLAGLLSALRALRKALIWRLPTSVLRPNIRYARRRNIWGVAT